MTGEEFVKLCFEEKKEILKEYFAIDSQLKVSGKIQSLIKLVKPHFSMFVHPAFIIGTNNEERCCDISGGKDNES